MPSSLPAIRQQTLQYLSQACLAGRPVAKLLQYHSRQIDKLLLKLWPKTPGFCLLATAGYGREQLFPYSDIDIVILHHPQAAMNAEVLNFCRTLQDGGFPISYSIRTIEDSLAFANKDLSFYTSLLEMRFITGDSSLFQAMQLALKRASLWPGANFFTAKLQEQQLRHQRLTRNLEPDIKNSPGGLRDIHLLNWLTQHYANHSAKRLFKRQEYQALLSAENLLNQIRFALHCLHQKAEDRLNFDQQKSIASQLQPNVTLADFMRQLQMTMQQVESLQALGLQLLREHYLLSKTKPVAINAYFQQVGDYLGIRALHTIKRHPAALLQGFVLLCQLPHLQGFDARTLRLLRHSIGLIDESFRLKAQHQALFLALFDQNQGVAKQLAQMHSLGILEAYLPEFASVCGQMQFDQFHHYTVDKHILAVVQQLNEMLSPDACLQLPLYKNILKTISPARTLYLACLFHDIGKGLGGDHSTLGAEIVSQFAKRHDLDADETQLLTWLVQNHLTLSHTAQKTDIANPEVIQRFAKRVGSKHYLDHLFILTVADIRGTNLKLWNDWKGSLLVSLYQSTLRVLETSEPQDLLANILSKQQQVYQNLSAEKISQLRAIWCNWPSDYFSHFDIEELSWQAQGILMHSPAIAVRNHPEHQQCELFLYMPHQAHLFSLVTSTIDRLGLNIAQARFYTLPNNAVIHHYVVLEQSGKTLNDALRLHEIREQLLMHLQGHSLPTIAKRRRLYDVNFATPTQVRSHSLPEQQQTHIEIITQDRPGLLATIAQVLDQFNVQIHAAKIATFGQRVEDSFYLSDGNLQVLPENKQVALCQALQDALANL